ncbi:hypothetical protein DEIPH_ctg064orf0085 [Deinococcus phoenicis]|uniref:Uncharacterized protein n=1 Tax=Deinococcus phoenicis TaxID=1476583 RepID=A0A016QL74_9DEIO|nr:hypothetical protein [Deinococcus phoenicis]EYB66910.1 hypothetical protein DEIPH_ctg064orf0085 [Deinococcus phoenicis]
MRLSSPPPNWKGLLVATLGFLTVWLLWPLLWVLLSFGTLHAQESDAAALLRAAPRAFLGGLIRVSGPPHRLDGRYLMRSQDELDRRLREAGWTFDDQMGAARFYQHGGKKLSTTCRQFTRHFSVCEARAEG